MSADLVNRVEQACAQLTGEGAPVTFAEVAARVGLSKATLEAVATKVRRHEEVLSDLPRRTHKTT